MLFILIDYGERAHEVVFGPMTETERVSHFGVPLALGRAMHLSGLPTTYTEYRDQRHQQLLEDYAHGPLTDELYASYRRALGPLRYRLLRLVQASVLPDELRDVLRLEPYPLVEELLRCYRFVPGAATSCAPYTALCYRAGSPDSCARWNMHQTPHSNLTCGARGGAGGRRCRDPVSVDADCDNGLPFKIQVCPGDTAAVRLVTYTVGVRESEDRGTVDARHPAKAFGKMKDLIRKAEARTKEALLEALGAAIAALIAKDARGSFEHCGYHASVQSLW
jgi:hypothetical protein